MPAILQQQGFDVTAAATVSEALQLINSQQFDALISDLNIGEASDGFTVVSAMRRTQPDCINFILTGYPAFDSALQAIRNQVDDYLVKPANVQQLVTSLQSKLNSPKGTRGFQRQSTSEFLRQHTNEILQRSLTAMKSHPRLSGLPITDDQRINDISDFLHEMVRQLESDCPKEPTDAMLAAGAKHGATRRQQGYSQAMLLDEIGVLESCIYESVQDSLLDLQLSSLIPDLRHINVSLNGFLREALRTFNTETAA